MKVSEPLNWNTRARRASREFHPALGFALLALACLLLVAWVRWSMPAHHTENIIASQIRLLRFIDQPEIGRAHV